MTTIRGHSPPPVFFEWITALEQRHLANLRIPEITRALRALSSVYVERRRDAGLHRALDTAGKRAAFGLFYGPLHFLTTYSIARELTSPATVRSILDLGCGTGAAGAAWALAVENVKVNGIDRHPWAVTEARWTYHALGLAGTARQGDLSRTPRFRRGDGVVAAYLLNELAAPARITLLRHLLESARAGAQILVIEPIATSISPWWSDAASEIEAAGGRADEWRFLADLPPQLRLLDKAAGLDHRELTARSLYCPANTAGSADAIPN